MLEQARYSSSPAAGNAGWGFAESSSFTGPHSAFQIDVARRFFPKTQVIIAATLALGAAVNAEVGRHERIAAKPAIMFDAGNVDRRVALPNVRADRRVMLLETVHDLHEGTKAWDDHDNVAPPAKAFADAIAFARLLSDSMPLPTPYASGDGEVGYVWRAPDAFLEVAFAGDGRLQWAAREGKVVVGGEPAFDFQTSPTRLPLELEKAMQELFERLA
jgi:hypothetical protein